MRIVKTALCPGCDLHKHSATKNPDGLCDACRGRGITKAEKPTTITIDLPKPDYKPMQAWMKNLYAEIRKEQNRR